MWLANGAAVSDLLQGKPILLYDNTMKWMIFKLSKSQQCIRMHIPTNKRKPAKPHLIYSHTIEKTQTRIQGHAYTYRYTSDAQNNRMARYFLNKTVD